MSFRKSNLAKLNPYQVTDLKDKPALALQFAPLVKKIALKIALRLPPDIELEDLIQVGMIGLLEAIDRYDPQHDANFKTFAEYRIRGSMLDELRAKDWIPRSVKMNASRLEKAMLELRKKGQLYPDHADLANEMGMTVEEFEVFLVKNASIPLFSIDDNGKEDKSEGQSYLEILSDKNQKTVDELLLQNELVERLEKALKLLPERDYRVMALSFHEEMNLKEIAMILDLTEARVCQIRTKCIAFLRSFLTQQDA